MSQKEPMEIYQENGLYGLKNDCGEVIISPQYRDFYSFSCGVACVRDVNYHYAYINYDNKPIVPFGRYVWIDPYFTCGYARVIQYSVIEDKQYWGIINTMGFIVVPCEYDNIWTLNEEYLDNLKAFKDNKECRINLRNADKKILLDGLKYIRTYSIEEFKKTVNCNKVYVKLNDLGQLYFTYGVNIGQVNSRGVPSDPVISIVINNNGRLFALLHDKSHMQESYDLNEKRKEQKGLVAKTNLPNYQTYDYEEERDYIESSYLDAFEGDDSNYWNID